MPVFAYRALVDSHPQFAPRLAKLLAESRFDRRDVLPLLGQLPRVVVNDLVSRLQSPEVKIAARALEALRLTNSLALVPIEQLRPLLSHRDQRIAGQAREALASLTPRDTAAKLVDLMPKAFPGGCIVGHAEDAYDRLGQMGKAAVPALVDGLRLEGGEYNCLVLIARAKQSHPQLVERTLPILAHAEPSTRAQAAGVLGQLSAGEPRVAGAVRSLLMDNKVLVRCRAAVALWKLVGLDEDSEAILRDGLAAYDDVFITSRVLIFVADFGPDALPFLPELMAAIRSKDSECRKRAAAAIEAMGPAAREALPELERLYRDASWGDREFLRPMLEALTGEKTEQVAR